MKKIAIMQSNYIPWKGYFDMIRAVDEFILYDDVQFTKNDWRNRNRIKTPNGLEWLSVPVGKNINRRIRDVTIPNTIWQKKHWKTIIANYKRSPYFDEVSSILKPIYLQHEHNYLSALNRELIVSICKILKIETTITSSWDYSLVDGQTNRLVDLCMQSGASEYISGPAAKSYIDTNAFTQNQIKLTWFEYSGYLEYQQLWGKFQHEVSIIDMLFNCGKEATKYMKIISK